MPQPVVMPSEERRSMNAAAKVVFETSEKSVPVAAGGA